MPLVEVSKWTGTRTRWSGGLSSWPAQPHPFFDAIQAQAIIEEMMAQVVNNGVAVEEAISQATDRMQQIADEMGALTQ